MKAMIDKNEFGDAFDRVFNLNPEVPIRSFVIYGVAKLGTSLERTISIYKTRITVSSRYTTKSVIASIDEGKEKFINNTITYLSDLKRALKSMLDEGYIDEIRVRAEEYDSSCYTSYDIDTFIDLFTKFLDEFVKEVE